MLSSTFPFLELSPSTHAPFFAACPERMWKLGSRLCVLSTPCFSPAVFFNLTELSSFMLIAIAAWGADGVLADELSLEMVAGAEELALRVGCGGGGGGGGPGRHKV